MRVVPKGKEGKFRLIINMRYVNEYMVKKKFKFEGFKDLSDLTKNGDHAITYLILPPGNIMWSCSLALEPTLGLSGRAVITFVTAFLLASPRPRGCSRR